MVDEIILKWQNKDWNAWDEFANSQFISDRKIIVIGGCARSGTTITRVMIDSHPDILCGPHSNLFIPTKLNFDLLANSFDIQVEVLKKLYSNDRAIFIENFIAEYLQQNHKSIWADKTARNILVIPWILHHFPKAKFIHVIRDGRDVICSLKTHRKRKIVGEELVLTGIAIPIEHCINRWEESIQRAILFRGHENYKEIRYEDLVLHTEKTLKEICQFVNIEFNNSMLNYYKHTGGTRNPLKFPQNIEATYPLYNTSIGRWKTDLAETEVNLVMHKVEYLLTLLGYT